MSAFFVTATGTDIGKTFVTAGLVRYLRESGAAVSAIKPVASGFEMAQATASDAGVLLDALGEAITPENIARISPWRFKAALSPDMAAAREGREIDFEKLTGFCAEAIAKEQGTLFIEGVGGIMAPLDQTHTVLDWMESLRLPLILVAGSYLGTISHILTALDILARRELNVAALVINDSGDGAVPIEETIATLKRFTNTPIAYIPRIGARDEARKDFVRLWNTLNPPALKGRVYLGRY